MKKRLLITYLIVHCFSVLSAQNLSGTWEGVITQDKGGILSEYTFKIFLTANKNNQVKGTAFVKADELDIYAIMSFKGKFDGEYINIQEDEILREKRIDDIFWCIKDYTLKLVAGSNKLQLEGRWRGYTHTGACIPGEIYLTKAEPRV